MSATESKPAEASVVAVADKKEDDEPQNELTKKFTEDEWKAVKELRVRPSTHSPSLYLILLPGHF